MSEAQPIAAGAVFERDHPFTWTQEGEGELAHERWRPGAWGDAYDVAPDKVLATCNGIGRVKYTVISVHRPPGYPERVFFTRQFTTPDGTLYASKRLMNVITRKFRKDTEGFPFEFHLEEL